MSRKRKIDADALQSILGTYSVSGHDLNFDCPFCRIRGEKRTGHLHVSIHKNAAICHCCEYKTRDLRNIFRQLGATAKVSLFSPRLGEQALSVIEDLWKKEERKESVELPDEFIPLTFPPRGMVGEACADYLRGRGVSDVVAESLRIGYATEGRFEGMLLFPFYLNGELTYFTSRQVFAFTHAKTINPKVKRSGAIYNFENAAMAKRVAVCEGVFDALSWSPFRVTGVGCLSCRITEDQLMLLGSLPSVEEFIVCFDADAHEHTLETARLLNESTDSKVSYILLPWKCKKCRKEDLRHEKGSVCKHCGSPEVVPRDPNNSRKVLKKFLRDRKRVSFYSELENTLSKGA